MTSYHMVVWIFGLRFNRDDIRDKLRVGIVMTEFRTEFYEVEK